MSRKRDEAVALWGNVEERVRLMAQDVGAPFQKDLDIDGVMSLVRGIQTKDEGGASSKLMAIFDGTLKCIQSVGGVVAEGASYVYGPATTCFNALSFVIKAYQDYQGIFVTLGELLENCILFLKRLDYYVKASMDDNLRDISTRFLEMFVEICRQSINLRSKRFRFKSLAKKVFLDDDKIRELLDRMKKLVEEERGMVSGQTLLGVKNIEKTQHITLDILTEDRVEQKATKELKKMKEALIRAQNWDEKSLVGEEGPDKVKEPRRVWDAKRRQYMDQLVPETGNWIETNEKYLAWLEADTGPGGDFHPILGIEGGDGTGKSQLVASIVTRLQNRRTSKSSKTRIAAAYYFLETQSKSASGNDSVAPAISRSLLWQFAADDPVFLKSASAVCERPDVFENHIDMWKQLLFENQDRANKEITFFIVLDGLAEGTHFHSFLVPVLRGITESSTNIRVRMLVSGTPAVFKELADAHQISFPTIKLGEENQSDIRLYIEYRMNAMGYLQKTDESRIKEARSKILDSLQEETNGNYRKINLALDMIAKTDDLDEIEKYLNNASHAAAEQIAADVIKLHETLTSKEIPVVNEIILWTLHARNYFTPVELEGAIALGLPATTTASLQRSLSTLGDKIKQGRYLLFDMDSDGKVVFKISLSEAKKRVPKVKTQGLGGHGDLSNISAYEMIHPTEIDMVKHYLKTVCPPQVYAKFDFDAFFEEKRPRDDSGHHVHQDPVNAHLQLALRCLRCLVEERTKETARLLVYTHVFLFNHLDSAENAYDEEEDIKRDGNLAITDRSLRSQVGEMLMRLFTEEYGIKSLLAFPEPGESPPDHALLESAIMPWVWWQWIIDDKGVETMALYLKDSAVLQNIREHTLVKEFTKSGCNKLEVLFRRATKLALDRLQQVNATKDDIGHAFLLLLTMKTALSDKHHYGVDDRHEYLKSLTLKVIEDVEAWAKSYAGLTDADTGSTWEAHMAYVLHLARYQYDDIDAAEAGLESERRARNAVEMDPSNWKASWILAELVESEALDLILPITDKLFNDKVWWENDLRNKELLATMLVRLGQNYLNKSDSSDDEFIDRALGAYMQSLDVYVADLSALRIALETLGNKSRWNDLLHLVERLLEPVPGKKEDDIPMGRIIVDWIYSFDSLCKSLVLAAKQTDPPRWDILRRAYDAALAMAPLDGSRYHQYWVSRHYGWSLMAEPTYRNDGLRILESLYEKKMSADNWYSNNIAADLVETLLPVYTRLDTAREPKDDSFSSAASQKITRPVSPRMTKTKQKVMSLYKWFQIASASENDTTKASAEIYFARYFFLRGEIAQAKEAARPLVTLGLDMMSDDDPSNDYLAFWYINQVFSAFQDQENMLAAWDMMSIANKIAYEDAVKKWEKENESWKVDVKKWEEGQKRKKKNEDGGGDSLADGLDKSSASEEEKDKGAITADLEDDADQDRPVAPDAPPSEVETIMRCGGLCGHTWTYGSEVWACNDDCGTVQLEQNCYEKLKNGSLFLFKCEKNHEFQFIGKRDVESIVDVPMGSVRVGKDIITLEEWKAKISAVYLDFEGSNSPTLEGPLSP